ncbi:inovirus Gp2 family protein [Pseudoalteromonas sp. BZB3]|uniref:inovirus Gp2 family protein n=1 Tax=Pseudoalteromonas sp. BZB3 TaxID=3136670 RepID=UPI0032C4249A
MSTANQTTLKVTHLNSFLNKPTLGNQNNPLVVSHLESINSTINKAIKEHTRTLAVRVDLRLPTNFIEDNNDVMKRFSASLLAKVKHWEKKKTELGIRIHSSNVRIVWAREQDSAQLHHYHVLLLFNKDTYFTLGRYDLSHDNLYSRIVTAWASALKVFAVDIQTLVHFPNNPTYFINANCTQFTEQFNALFHRVSYFAKVRTKQFGEGHRTFGCSQK